jgi:hypothetical protein
MVHLNGMSSIGMMKKFKCKLCRNEWRWETRGFRPECGISALGLVPACLRA